MRVALLLAGGEGRRFGTRDKLLEEVGGQPVLAHALRAARLAGRRTLLIIPPGFGQRRMLIARLRWPGLIVRVASEARTGIGASLAAGLAALRPVDREMMIFLADMPFARAHRGRLGAGWNALRPVYAGRPGHPVLVRTAAVRSLKLSPSSGLGTLLDRRRTALFPTTEGSVTDIDTPAALRRLRYRIATQAGAFRIARSERPC